MVDMRKSLDKLSRFTLLLLIFEVVFFGHLLRKYEENEMHDKRIQYSRPNEIKRKEENNLDEKSETNHKLIKTSNYEEKEQQLDEQIRQFSDTDKIKIAIHIGPHKTGTTSIQRVMRQSKEIIGRDGYVMPKVSDAPGQFSENPSHNIAFSFHDFPRITVDREAIFKASSAFIQRSQREKKNILLSSEEFDKANPKRMKIAFSDSFETHIVIVYRRFYEWIESFYIEIFKGPKPGENYVTWITKHFKGIKKRSPLAMREAFGTFFENIVILNYHDEEQRLLENFFCDAISGLNKTCQHIKTQVNEMHENVRPKNTDFTQLIKLSKERNIINQGIGLEQAEKRVQSFVHNTLNIETKDLPSKCLDDDVLDNMYQYSLHQERTLFPVWFEERGGEDRFRNDFEKFYETSSCAIDSEAILEDEKWVAFLRSLPTP